MDKNYFLLEDKIKEIDANFLIKNGWLKIYEDDSENRDDFAKIYCSLISNDKVSKYSEDENWPFEMGEEGKPAVGIGNTYKSNFEEGVEPFLFYKDFSFIEESIEYIDVAEEFILYWQLYEKGKNKQNRTFYYVSDGELDEVLIIEPKLIKVKIKYLKEYITMRDMNLVVCYEFKRYLKKIPSNWKIKDKDDLIEGSLKKNNFIYRYSITDSSDKTASWILGKAFIKPNEIKKSYLDSRKI